MPKIVKKPLKDKADKGKNKDRNKALTVQTAPPIPDEGPSVEPSGSLPVLMSDGKPKPDVKVLHYRVRPESDVEGLGVLSPDKRVTKLRDKIGVSADHLANELMFAVSGRNKKDKEYIKGLVWSLGVLVDKLDKGPSDVLSVRLPSKLMENVKLAISVQIEKKSTPSPNEDNVLETTQHADTYVVEAKDKHDT